MGAIARRSDKLYRCGVLLIHERWALTAQYCPTSESLGEPPLPTRPPTTIS
ncbi:hypothetical protein [Amycolatopsis sp. NPDC052450]|uniref:hypothetical protein n=1 Tax=Amycolatopsis sp. NPDC052450 TaxID=3363937 RepID=UPI0037CAD6F9